MPTLDTTKDKPPSTEELTKAQVLIGGDSEELAPDSSTSGSFYKLVRKMRRHPTIALVRDLSVAAILAAPWSVESNDKAPPEAKDKINDIMQSHRINLLKTSLFGCIDFGWQPYEKIFAPDAEGFMAIKKLKPLLQDLTTILIDVENGSFAGIAQDEVVLTLESALLVSLDVEGTNWYGEPRMKSVEVAYNQWNLCNDAAVRYDKKLAGAHWIIHYPIGETKVNGVDTDNYELARVIAASLQASGTVIVPNFIHDIVSDANDQAGETAWKIELLSAYPTSNVAFTDRLKYLDAMMSRAFRMPERATLEGQFGTKAEAEAHGDFAITNMELSHQIIVQHYNWHLVNQMMRINYGPDTENTVYLKVAPITDTSKQYLRKLYNDILNNQAGFANEFDNIDMQSMRDRLEVPSLAEGDKESLKNITDSLDPDTGTLSFKKLFGTFRE